MMTEEMVPDFSAVVPEMTMGRLLEIFPGAQRALFRGYHIGGCSSCGFGPEETLAQVCARQDGVAVAEVIEFLKQSAESDRQMEVTPREAQVMVAEGKAVLVDIRTREEFDAVNIPGSTLFSQELMGQLPGWDSAVQIVFVDHEGKRSPDAAAYFAGHGMSNVRCLRGGIDAWSCEVDTALPRYRLQ